eukprot:11946331-Prorocentrum_lima.AAC.1
MLGRDSHSICGNGGAGAVQVRGTSSTEGGTGGSTSSRSRDALDGHATGGSGVPLSERRGTGFVWMVA